MDNETRAFLEAMEQRITKETSDLRSKLTSLSTDLSTLRIKYGGIPATLRTIRSEAAENAAESNRRFDQAEQERESLAQSTLRGFAEVEEKLNTLSQDTRFNLKTLEKRLEVIEA